jgi:hypothetical protein
MNESVSERVLSKPNACVSFFFTRSSTFTQNKLSQPFRVVSLLNPTTTNPMHQHAYPLNFFCVKNIHETSVFFKNS